MRLHHIALNCKDIVAMEKWYTQHLGFKRAHFFDIGDGKSIVFIKAGDMYLELFNAEGQSPLTAPEADGHHFHGTVRHIAFKVDNVDAELEKLGSAAVIKLGPLSFDDAIPGWRTVWIADPEGNIVEISQGYVDQDNPPPLE